MKQHMAVIHRRLYPVLQFGCSRQCGGCHGLSGHGDGGAVMQHVVLATQFDGNLGTRSHAATIGNLACTHRKTVTGTRKLRQLDAAQHLDLLHR